MQRTIDYLCGDFTPEGIRKNFLEGAERQILDRMGKTATLRGYQPDEFMARMSSIGVEKVLLVGIVTWDYWKHQPVEETTIEEILTIRNVVPDRIFGLYGINPFRRLDGVAELEEAIRVHEFRGMHIHPHGFGLSGPHHAYYYPYYAKCVELRVPAVISMGHTMDMMPMEAGRPSHIDEVALYFPDLRIVIAHTGWPWVEEAIAVTVKHPNVYLGTSAHSPKYWKPEMVRFLDSSRGRGKVLFGTDYPIVKHEDALDQIEALELREDSKKALLHDVAADLFNLD